MNVNLATPTEKGMRRILIVVLIGLFAYIVGTSVIGAKSNNRQDEILDKQQQLIDGLSVQLDLARQQGAAVPTPEEVAADVDGAEPSPVDEGGTRGEVALSVTPEQLSDAIIAYCAMGSCQGPTGAIGPQGVPGVDGLNGSQGPIGATGAIGSQGPAGATGEAGAVGATGATGEAGAIGSTGLQGEAGATGAAGPQGEPGPAGATGAAGPAGPQGEQGVPGPIGPQGPQGEPGPAGEATTTTSTIPVIG